MSGQLDCLRERASSGVTGSLKCWRNFRRRLICGAALLKVTSVWQTIDKCPLGVRSTWTGCRSVSMAKDEEGSDQ